uniref:Cystic fibrosis transmembrane conductance regulator n=1 Tax=Noccaea caerulescens TaxID=107243 RepID=A0A1J3JBI6_NOCCA
MVGIFSRFSVGRSSHRRTQSAIDDKEVLAPNSDVTAATTTTATTATHGIEVATEFKPVEHPVEPLDNDQPIQCPLPEPSILNDGRIWKERVSASMMKRGDLQIAKDEAAAESDGSATKPPRPSPSNRSILPSLSAPEHDLLNLLEECNAMQTVTSKNG